MLLPCPFTPAAVLGINPHLPSECFGYPRGTVVRPIQRSAVTVLVVAGDGQLNGDSVRLAGNVFECTIYAVKLLVT